MYVTRFDKFYLDIYLHTLETICNIYTTKHIGSHIIVEHIYEYYSTQ